MATQRSKSSTRKKRKFREPGVKRAATVREEAVLRLVSEQGSLSVGQLGRLLGVTYKAALRRANGLLDLGWVRFERYAGVEDVWLWPRAGGTARAGTGFRDKQVAAVQLAHRMAVTEVRILLAEEYPSSTWVCDRRLWQEMDGKGCVPDGLFELDGKRIAIEVELSRKPDDGLRKAIGKRVEKYDGVIYFCSSSIEPLVAAIREEVAADALEVRRVPLKELSVSGSWAKQKETVSELEQQAVELVVKEGVVAVRLLGPLLGIGVEPGVELAESMEARGLAARGFEVADDGGWIWGIGSSSRLSGTGMQAFRPCSVGVLEHRYQLALVRLKMLESHPQMEWRTRRELLQGRPGGRRSDVPAAVAVVNGKEIAIEMFVFGPQCKRGKERVRRFASAYDEVVCWSMPGAQETLASMLDEIDSRSITMKVVGVVEV